MQLYPNNAIKCVDSVQQLPADINQTNTFLFISNKLKHPKRVKTIVNCFCVIWNSIKSVYSFSRNFIPVMTTAVHINSFVSDLKRISR